MGNLEWPLYGLDSKEVIAEAQNVSQIIMRLQGHKPFLKIFFWPLS